VFAHLHCRERHDKILGIDFIMQWSGCVCKEERYAGEVFNLKLVNKIFAITNVDLKDSEITGGCVVPTPDSLILRPEESSRMNASAVRVKNGVFCAQKKTPQSSMMLHFWCNTYRSRSPCFVGVDQSTSTWRSEGMNESNVPVASVKAREVGGTVGSAGTSMPTNSLTALASARIVRPPSCLTGICESAGNR
jgi:hypothetical protein